jgi:GNAT superfamily N-acetyltransferase
MSTVVQKLPESSRNAYLDHLLQLPPEDVYLRFGSPLRAEAIAAYVARIDFDRDVVFGIHDDALALVAAAHVAFIDDGAELGVSVAAGHRERGNGTALVQRAAEHVRNRFRRRIYMHCLAENAAMMRIAQHAGMRVIVDTGEADAWLALPPADAMSVASEAMNERVAIFDYALKSQVAALRGVNRALGGAERT